jgi:autophagy-related protein 13
VGPERVEGGRMPSEEYESTMAPGPGGDSGMSTTLAGGRPARLSRRASLNRGGRASPSFYSSSFGHTQSGESSGSATRGSRFSFGSRKGQADDEEPFIFQMSELGDASRRSLEDGRGSAASRRGGGTGGSQA